MREGTDQRTHRSALTSRARAMKGWRCARRALPALWPQRPPQVRVRGGGGGGGVRAPLPPLQPRVRAAPGVRPPQMRRCLPRGPLRGVPPDRAAHLPLRQGAPVARPHHSMFSEQSTRLHDPEAGSSDSRCISLLGTLRPTTSRVSEGGHFPLVLGGEISVLRMRNLCLAYIQSRKRSSRTPVNYFLAW